MLGHRTLTTEDYISILKRRAWMIAIPAVLLSAIAFGITFFMTPQYTSQTLVLIDQQKVPDNYVKPVIASDLDSRLASMKEQMLSRSRIQPIIDRYNLGGSHMSMDDRIDMVRKDIAIKPIHSEISHSGGLPGFFISFTANDAHTAQLVCGEITSLFTSENLKSREAAAQGTTDFLKGQLADAKKNLDDQDAKLAAFQRENIGKLPGEGSPNVNMLTSLNTQLEAATQALARMEQDKSYLEAVMSQQAQAATAAASGTTTLSPRGVPQTQQQADLQALQAQEADLSSHYTADYPDVIAVRRKIADLRKEIARERVEAAAPTAPGAPARQPESIGTIQLRAQLKSLELGIQAKRTEQAQIQSSVHMYQDRIQSSPLVEEQYKELTRDYKTAEGFYNDLLGKMNQSKMATDLEARMQGEQFTVMDAPNLPDSPTFPKRPLFAGGGLFAGIVFGLAFVALLEYLNTALRTERDVWAFTQLPTLAVIAYAPEMTTTVESRVPWLRRFLKQKAKTEPAMVQG